MLHYNYSNLNYTSMQNSALLKYIQLFTIVLSG